MFARSVVSYFSHMFISRAHVSEAKEKSLSSSNLVDSKLASHDDLLAELKLLAEQEDKLHAEIK